eukprot:scaffold148563_cov35-Prasinocladus_malaysianus.AAC.1
MSSFAPAAAFSSSASYKTSDNIDGNSLFCNYTVKPGTAVIRLLLVGVNTSWAIDLKWHNSHSSKVFDSGTIRLYLQRYRLMLLTINVF